MDDVKKVPCVEHLLQNTNKINQKSDHNIRNTHAEENTKLVEVLFQDNFISPHKSLTIAGGVLIS